MIYYFYFLAFVLGTVFGSFGNAWAWRIVNKESIAKGRSHCTNCNHELGAKDLVPLLSYIFLGGKCRYCGEKIPFRYFLAELILGLYFLSVFVVYGMTLDCLRLLILGFLLFVSSIVDIDSFELPDGLLMAAAVAALLRLPDWKSILIGAFAISVPLLVIVLIMDKILKKETMGGGDIKLVAVLGMHFGAGNTLLLLIISCIIGIIFAYASNKGKSVQFPFGPVLSIAAWITALVGQNIISWYISLI